MDSEHTFSNIPTNVERSRDELLAQISRYRQDKGVSQVTNDEDYVLLYAYSKFPAIGFIKQDLLTHNTSVIVSRQLSNEIVQITSELGRIFPASDGELVGAVRV
jgi:hypothetical protein